MANNAPDTFDYPALTKQPFAPVAAGGADIPVWVYTSRGWVSLVGPIGPAGPAGPAGPSGVGEYAVRSVSGASTSCTNGAWTRLPLGALDQASSGYATCYRWNADGTITILADGWYEMFFQLVGPSGVPAGTGFQYGVWLTADDTTPAAPGANWRTEVPAASSGSPIWDMSATAYLQANQRIGVSVFNRHTAPVNLQQNMFTLARFGSGPQGPTGAQGAAGTFAVADFPVLKTPLGSSANASGITTLVEPYLVSSTDMRFTLPAMARNCLWEITYHMLLLPADATWVRADLYIELLDVAGTVPTGDADGATQFGYWIQYWNSAAGTYTHVRTIGVIKLAANDPRKVRPLLNRSTGTWGYYRHSSYFFGTAKVVGFY